MPVRLALWRAALIFVGLNLAWEIAQLPLYTIWWTDPGPRIAFAVLHCTAGDLMIGAASLAAALLFVGRGWPEDCAARIRVVALTTLFGVGYTVFSEWLNVSARGSWAYTEWMPVLPPFGTGLTPILQWLILPGLALHSSDPGEAPNDPESQKPQEPPAAPIGSRAPPRVHSTGTALQTMFVEHAPGMRRRPSNELQKAETS